MKFSSPVLLHPRHYTWYRERTSHPSSVKAACQSGEEADADKRGPVKGGETRGSPSLAHRRPLWMRSLFGCGRSERASEHQDSDMRNFWLHIAQRPATVIRNQTLQEDDMEFGTIEREIYVEASPEIVFEVVSSPGPPARSGGRTRPATSRSPGRRGRSSSVTATPAGAWRRSPSSTCGRRGASRSAGPTRPARSRRRATRCWSPST